MGHLSKLPTYMEELKKGGEFILQESVYISTDTLLQIPTPL